MHHCAQAVGSSVGVMGQVTSGKGINKFYDERARCQRRQSLRFSDKEFVVFVGPVRLSARRRAQSMIAGLEGDQLQGDISIDGNVDQSNWRPWTVTSPWCSRTTRSTRI